jgi:2-polyprenyl-6-methoxyphenol hydroxylase-like FAD-dependent oxidoreductase
MSERFDVVVVGARCAGSPLAALLARRGLRVAVVERVTFPRDTLSTHTFQAQALAFLERLGVAEKVRATGATLVRRVDFRQEDFKFTEAFPQRPGDIGGTTSVRRHLLDPILAEAAAEAGVEMRMGTKVTGLVEERGRVAGVKVERDGSQSALLARLVVGADGRSSTVAGLVGARKYNVTANERFAYWSFFEGAAPGPDPAFVLHRWGERFVVALPADSGLHQAMVMPELRMLPRFRADLEGSYMEHMRACEPVAETLCGARRVGKIFGMVRWECYFREASGPGWALVGDSGHFKDPCAGQGIQDAFRQAEALAPAIVRGLLDGSDDAADQALAEWGAWRDWDAVGHYWLANDMGKAGAAPAPVVELGRWLLERGELDELVDVFSHRNLPSEVITPPRLAAAVGRLLARPGGDRRALLRELGPLVAENIRRQRLNRWPVYAGADVAAGARAPNGQGVPTVSP